LAVVTAEIVLLGVLVVQAVAVIHIILVVLVHLVKVLQVFKAQLYLKEQLQSAVAVAGLEPLAAEQQDMQLMVAQVMLHLLQEHLCFTLVAAVEQVKRLAL
jgi:hypothetical protein